MAGEGREGQCAWLAAAVAVRRLGDAATSEAMVAERHDRSWMLLFKGQNSVACTLFRTTPFAAHRTGVPRPRLRGWLLGAAPPGVYVVRGDHHCATVDTTTTAPVLDDGGELQPLSEESIARTLGDVVEVARVEPKKRPRAGAE